MTNDFVASSNLSKRVLIKRTFFSQFALLALFYIFTPGYISYFRNTNSLWSLAVALLWQAFGIALYTSPRLNTKSIFLSTLQTIGFIVLFMLPPTLMILTSQTFVSIGYVGDFGPTMNGLR